MTATLSFQKKIEGEMQKTEVQHESAFWQGAEPKEEAAAQTDKLSERSP